MSTNNQAPPLDEAAFHQLLQSQHDLEDRLREIWEAIRASSMDVAAADLRRRYTHIPDHIVEGNARLVSGNPGFGGSVPLTAGTAVQLLHRNTSRLGGTIINSGAASVTLFLCSLDDQVSAGAGGEPLPQIWLGANGGAWDCRLGNVLWCGTVVAVAAAGGSSVTVAEV